MDDSVVFDPVHISLNPLTLVFCRGTKERLSIIANVTSSSDQRIIFKLSCSNPARYSVTPNIGVLQVKANCTTQQAVTVTFRGWNKPDTHVDRFRMEVRRQPLAMLHTREALRGGFDEAGPALAKADITARVETEPVAELSTAIEQKKINRGLLQSRCATLHASLTALQSAIAERERLYENSARMCREPQHGSHNRIGFGYVTAAAFVFLAVVLARLFGMG